MDSQRSPVVFQMYCRLTNGLKGQFLEFLVVYVNGRLCLPIETLERFDGRVTRSVKDVDSVLTVHLTDSKKPLITPKRSYADIQTNGIWICSSDAVMRGNTSSVYGVPLDPSILSLRPDISQIYDLLNVPGSVDNEPIVVYHGTDRSLVKSILAEGLKPSYGMLGTAVYLGSFWKAFRFATLTQDYKKRPGAILRIYAFWPKVYQRTLYGPCECCTGPGSHIADHKALWSKHAPAVMVAPGLAIKNEEFACLDDTSLIIDSVAYAIATTEHHEPLNRSLQIL